MAVLFISLFLIIFYMLFILKVLRGWRKLRALDRYVGEECGLSIIIPCRNESANLPFLFYDLEQQLFPKDKFQVVFVDDHSEDGTFELFEELQKSHSFSSILLSLEQGEGKKAALTAGIENSEFNYILTTDADCRLPKKWIKTFSDYFSATNASLLAGAVEIKAENSFFSKIQSFEFASLSGITAAFFGLKKPIMCNGANLAFKKELFYKVNGYNKHLHVASGDDVFFLHETKDLNEPIGYVFEREAVIETLPKKSLKNFFQQRIRWAGKSSHYKDKDILNVGFLISIYNLLLLFLLFLTIVGESFFSLLLILFASKFLMDFLFMYMIRHFFNLNQILLYSFALSLFYPFYAVGIGVISLFAPVKWKR